MRPGASRLYSAGLATPPETVSRTYWLPVGQQLFASALIRYRSQKASHRPTGTCCYSTRTTTAKRAQHAGVSAGTLGSTFPTQENLLDKRCAYAMTQSQQPLLAGLGAPQRGEYLPKRLPRWGHYLFTLAFAASSLFSRERGGWVLSSPC